MALPKLRATRTPKALTGITVGTVYAVQNQGMEELYVTTDAAAPVPDTIEQSETEGFFKVPPFAGGLNENGTIRITAETGESIWVWRRRNGQDLEVVWAEAG